MVLQRLKDDPTTSAAGSKTYQGVEVVWLDPSSRVNTKPILIVYWIACMNVLRMALLTLPH